MKTLSDLRRIALTEAPAAEPGVAALLVTWVRHDTAAGEWLTRFGVTAAAWVAALDGGLAPSVAEDRAVLAAASAAAGMAPATALDLLRSLADLAAHPVHQALAALGLSWAELTGPEAARPSPLPGLMALGVTLREAPAAGWQRYGRDLTAEAQQGVFAGLLPRPGEQARIIDVLLRREKGNVALTGPAGVGKTALIEGLALAALHPEHPLHGWRLVELSLGKLVAGTHYRGQFEERLEGVLRELTALHPAVLFIDELHLLVGSGRAEGAPMDGGNLLKPHLARGTLRVIGATTTEEYHRHIARDKALARRFQVVALAPPGPEVTRQMLAQQAAAIATHHALMIPERTLERVIALTEQHLPHRHQPDKSIDLLDTAAAMVRRQGRRQIDEDDLLETLSHLTGLPVGRLSGDARVFLARMGERLKARLKGQDEVVDRVVATLLQRRLELDNRRRPLAVFLFTGDTGVGKTELGRLLAREFLGDPGRLLHLDLAEYAGPAAIHKLIGAPAGLVGSEDEGILIQALQHYSQGVLLLDELEKADPEVHRLLLGLCDEGRLRSARGEVYDARAWIIVLTSNVLSAELLNRPAPGFAAVAASVDPREYLAEHFPKELLGRVDEVLVFRRLDGPVLRQILQGQLEQARELLAAKGVRIEADATALLDYLQARLEAHTGARGIARAIERGLLQPLARALLLADPNQPVRVVLGEAFYRHGQVTLDRA